MRTPGWLALRDPVSADGGGDCSLVLCLLLLFVVIKANKKRCLFALRCNKGGGLPTQPSFILLFNFSFYCPA